MNVKLRIVVSLLMTTLLNSGLHAQEILPNTWVPNGPVHATMRQGDIMYVGGEFSQVAIPMANGVVINTSTGLPRINDEKFTGIVNHAVSDGQGGYFLTGNFAPVSGSGYKFVQHLLADGTFSDIFNPIIPGTSQIRVLAATNDRVIIRTRYSTSNNNPIVNALYCVGYDGTIYWTRNANGKILDGIISDNDTFYMIGNFTRVEGQSRTRAAAFDVYTGELLPWNTGSLISAILDPLQTQLKTVSMGIAGNELFIRWRVSNNEQPQATSMVVSVDLLNGIPTGWTLPLSFATSSAPMAVHNGRVYLGTSTDQGLLILDAATKQTFPNPAGIVVSSPGTSGNRISAIAAVGNTIYLAGGNKVDENGNALPDVVAFNETTLERENFNGTMMRNYAYPGTNNTSNPYSIRTLASGPNSLFIGGYFPGFSAEPRKGIYAYNVVSGDLLPFSIDYNEIEVGITKLFATPSHLYVSGFFESINGQPRIAGLACFNLADGSLNEWNPDIGINWGSLYGNGDRVYIYGGFNSVDGNDRAGVAAFDAATGLLLPWNPTVPLIATALTANETGVFVAGRTTDNINNAIFFFDRETGSSLFPSIEFTGGNGANAVRTMASNADRLYVGGDFTTLIAGAEQFIRTSFAAIDLNTGLVNDMNLQFPVSQWWQSSPAITAMDISDGSIYLGGNFHTINGLPRHSVAAISTATGEVTDWKFKSFQVYAQFALLYDRTINSIQVYNDGVFISGGFDSINDVYNVHNHLKVSPDESNVVTGTVFFDNNQNGVQEAGESGVPNLLMELQPGNIFYPTDANGHYTVYTGIGNYTIRPVHPTYAITVNPGERQLSFSDDLQLSEDNDFAVSVIPNITDMGITVTTDQTLRPGFYFNYVVSYTNHGTVASSGSIEVTYDSRLLYQHSSVTPTAQTSNMLTYAFTDVQPGESQSILINMRVPVPTLEGSLFGEELSINVVIVAQQNDDDPDNNSASLMQEVVGSVDPNDKLVTPQGYGPNGYVNVDTDHLEYTIRFQNVGNAPATFVTLEDVLDPNLNISTFTVVSASHAYTYEIVNRTLNVLFNNINLPDSVSDEPGSHGYFTFTIGLNDNLPAGTQIQNQASIVFDYNLPIITNTVVNTLRNPPYETTIFLPDSVGFRNAEIVMPVFVNDWTDLLGAQFSVAWDNTVATFVGVESFGLPGIDLNAFNLTNVNDGYFSVAWSDPSITPQSLADSTALFHIRFRLTGDYGATTPVAITHAPVTIEAIAADYQTVEVLRIDGEISISQTITIQGAIQYANAEAVQNVTVQLEGTSQAETATNSEGQFLFLYSPGDDEQSVTLRPVKEQDPNLLNGIDVQDVASIRRHILRTELFTTAHQVIAADVSNNNTVSIQDAILLQALILGVETDLPNGRQWTFVDAEHTFESALSPFPYPQNIEIELEDLTQEDRFNFTAIKLGDVTLDRDNTQAGRTKGQEVVLEVSEPIKQEDGLYEVAVSSLGFVDIAAYQFTISWDYNKLQLVNVINEEIEGVYGEHKINEGLLTTIWDEKNGVSISLADHAQLFKLRFRPLTEAGPGNVSITDQLTAMRMFDDKLNRVDFTVRQAISESKASGHFYPNPFDDMINISFTLQEAQVVKIEILNDLGQKVGELENTYPKGWNEVKIDGTNFRKGLYLFSKNVGGKREITKLIKK